MPVTHEAAGSSPVTPAILENFVTLFSQIIDIEKSFNSGKPGSFRASDIQCANIAKDFGIHSVKYLVVQFQVEQLINKVYKIVGSINAIVVQESCYSTAHVTTSISEPFSVLLFYSEKRLEEYEISHPDDDSDTMVDGEYDLGQLALEYVSLNIPTYPKLPHEERLVYKEFEVTNAQEKILPFANLEEKLKK